MKQIEAFLLDQPTATLEEIAEMAKISPITIYRKFDTRDGLIRSIVEYILDELAEVEKVMLKFKGSYHESIHNMITLLYPHLTSIKFLFQLDSVVNSQKRIKDVYDKVLALRKKYSLYVYKLVEKGQKEKVLRSDLDAKWITTFVIGFIFSLRELTNDPKKHQATIDMIVTTIVDGVSK
jgi:TetR/AcrR family transcriptional regulator, mexCD-oprJ operon repressor